MGSLRTMGNDMSALPADSTGRAAKRNMRLLQTGTQQNRNGRRIKRMQRLRRQVHVCPRMARTSTNTLSTRMPPHGPDSHTADRTAPTLAARGAAVGHGAAVLLRQQHHMGPHLHDNSQLVDNPEPGGRARARAPRTGPTRGGQHEGHPTAHAHRACASDASHRPAQPAQHGSPWPNNLGHGSPTPQQASCAAPGEDPRATAGKTPPSRPAPAGAADTGRAAQRCSAQTRHTWAR